MSNRGNTTNRWSVTYEETVYAILSVQALTNHQFEITDNYISWAMEIDATNQAAETIRLEVCIPRYTLRSRQIFDPAHTSEPSEQQAPPPSPATQGHAPVSYPFPALIPIPVSEVATPASYPFPISLAISIPEMSTFPATVVAGGPYPNYESLQPVPATTDSNPQTGATEPTNASRYWDNDWGEDQNSGEEGSADNNNSNDNNDNDYNGNGEEEEENYWSLEHQIDILGESYEDYKEH